MQYHVLGLSWRRNLAFREELNGQELEFCLDSYTYISFSTVMISLSLGFR